MAGPYISLQPFYRQSQYTSSLSFQTKLDTIHWKNDDFGVKNSTLGLNCILGCQIPI